MNKKSFTLILLLAAVSVMNAANIKMGKGDGGLTTIVFDRANSQFLIVFQLLPRHAKVHY